MANPGELIRRAKENRRRREVLLKENVQRTEPQVHPMPIQAVPHHGAYTELMRSHDRVSTRHIGKQN